jgi:hypothetical protein
MDGAVFNIYDGTRNFFVPGANVAQQGAPATFGVRFGDI